MPPYENRYWWSNDGLRLHYRDYPGDASREPIVCMAGLTRNARDFEALAARLAATRRVVAVDFRGRGGSAFAKDSKTYVPLTYVDDLEALLAQQGIERFVACGTSLGGIVAMMIAATGRTRLAGAVLNDIGPEIDPRGLRRIRNYVGKGSVFPTWLDAARAVQESNREVYPDWNAEDWLAMAKRLYRLNTAGRIVLDYDLRIAEPFGVPGGEAAPDMWPVLAALNDVPTLIIRGELSDILTAATAERMAATLDRSELVTVPRVGHTPILTESILAAPIDRLLAAADKEPVLP